MINLIVGPMGSGKSKLLIEKYKQIYVNSKQKTIAFKPSKDTRDNNFISSRNGEKIKAESVKSFSEILNKLKNEYEDIKFVIVDEIQFLDFEGFLDLYDYAMSNGLNLLFGGLNLTSEMKPFETVKNIMPYCHNIFSCSAVCKCGNLAHYSKCLVEKKEEVLIGADDLYSAACYKCFKEE